MDRNELVEKALEHRVTYTGRCACGARLPDDSPRTTVEHVLDAILPDVIEAIREEAAQIAFDHAGSPGSAAFEIVDAIRAAVLGDALKGGTRDV